MAFKGARKRTLEGSQKLKPLKRRKAGFHPDTAAQKQQKSTKGKGKEKASDKDIISIPMLEEESDDEAALSDQDAGILKTYGTSLSFLTNLDTNGIARSKKVIERLHSLSKPIRTTLDHDDLPSIHSHSDDENVWSSDMEDNDNGTTDSGSDKSISSRPDGVSSDEEMPYERIPRKLGTSWATDEEKSVPRLPIKLKDGRIQKTGTVPLRPLPSDTDVGGRDKQEDGVSDGENFEVRKVEDISTGARFGRLAVVDVIGNKSRKAAIQGAKEQIAQICQEILAEPENSLGLLRRLHTFSLHKLSTPSHPDPVPNDVVIRKLTFLSQLVVFKDIIPGYRIRALTDKEKEEKVSQMVARTRDWEQGLLTVYQSYLRSLESELKGHSELASVALQCMCTLAVEVTHFNFRINILSCVVAQLSRRSWSHSADLCARTLIKILRADLTGIPSLEIVRLLNRMIKDRKYNVHPNVLSCLLHLRLKTELGVRASESKAEKEENVATARKGKVGKRKQLEQRHLSRKAKRALKERKEIEKEFREAEAAVDVEERASTQTETLKLLFVLYFSILKKFRDSPLLPAALRGISKFAHLVNIDFFRDLMQVLKGLVERHDVEGETSVDKNEHPVNDVSNGGLSLLCILTAFELLSGQGEALNIDLSDFIGELYAITRSLAFAPDIESPLSHLSEDIDGDHLSTTADMLFQALGFVFFSRSVGSAAPSWRSAAFAKRLLSASMHWPPATVLRVLDFVRQLISKDAKLEALLSTDERAADGVYRADIDDPQLCNPFATSFWELHLLRTHSDARVRAKANELCNFVRT